MYRLKIRAAINHHHGDRESSYLHDKFMASVCIANNARGAHANPSCHVIYSQIKYGAGELLLRRKVPKASGYMVWFGVRSTRQNASRR